MYIDFSDNVFQSCCIKVLLPVLAGLTEKKMGLNSHEFTNKTNIYKAKTFGTTHCLHATEI